MKKVWTLLLALVLCVTLAAGAMADWMLEPVKTYTDYASWLYGSDIVRVSVNNGYQLYHADGTMVSPKVLKSAEYQYGFIFCYEPGTGLNSRGVMDRQGNVVIPFQYGDIDLLSEKWAVAFTLKDATSDNYDYTASDDKSKHFIIDTIDVYNLEKRACVGTLTRSNFKEADAVYNVINIQDRSTGKYTSYDGDFNALGEVEYSWEDEYATPDMYTYRENGQTGIKDASGNIIMKPSFYSVYDFYGSYAEVYTGEKYGLIDKQGNVIVPAEYEDIVTSSYGPKDEIGNYERYVHAGYIGVEQDGKLGYVNMQGAVTCAPKYSADIMDNRGASALYTDMEGNTHILSADGVDTTLPKYEYVHALDGFDGLLYRVYDGNDYGMVDWHGQLVLPCEYSTIDASDDGEHLIIAKDYKSRTVYKVSMSVPAAEPAPAAAPAPAAESAPAAGSSAKSALSAKLAQMQGSKTQQSAAPAVEAPQTKSGLSDAKIILGSVLTLLEADAAANQLTISMLLDDILVLSQDASVQGIVTSVKTLIDTDAATNAAAAATLLRTIEGQL